MKERRVEKGTPFNALVRIILIALSLLIAAAHIRPALSEYYSHRASEFNEDDLLLASRITDEDARYHYLLGLLSYALHDRAALNSARERLSSSLKRNPTDSQAWLALAKADRDLGMKEQGAFAAGKAASMDKNNANLIWETGVLFLLDNRSAEAIGLFRRYLSMSPEEQENVYSLCYMMGVDPAYILDNLIPPGHAFYSRYLSFLEANKLLKESGEVWKRLETYDPDRKEYLGYADFLIENGEIEKAQDLWADFVKRFKITKGKESGNLIWNGDFELPIDNGGFDWRLGKSDGVKIFRDKDTRMKGYASLSVSFDGKGNPGLYIAQQIVPVDPRQKYRLSGYIKSEKITTQNGIVFEVSGFLCDPFLRQTESVTGTTLWKKIELEFVPSSNCGAVRVGIKRERSEKFDNKISGDAWIDSLEMTLATRD